VTGLHLKVYEGAESCDGQEHSSSQVHKTEAIKQQDF